MDSLEIYSEMFPKIDREVIKLILQELNSDEILDALINISTDSSLSQQTAVLISEQLRSPIPLLRNEWKLKRQVVIYRNIIQCFLKMI